MAVLVWSSLLLVQVVDSHCPQITLSHRSTLTPVGSNGSMIVLYQEFLTEGSPSDLNISWSRIPYPLHLSQGHYKTDNQIVGDNTVNASLTLWGAQLLPDEGNYSVVATNGCTSNSTHYYLRLYKCEVTRLPEPLQQHNVTVLTEPMLPNTLHLTTTFHGTTELFWSITRWTFGSAQCVESAAPSSVFSCNRTVIGCCTFTANLWISNPTYVNSGRYVVQAITSQGLRPPNNASIDLYVVRQPRVNSCTKQSVDIDITGQARFDCQVSNYSDFTEVFVVKNNRTWFNHSTEEISINCWRHIPDNTIATCTVRLSSSLPSKSLFYNLCVGYNNTVIHKTPPHCSDSIAVKYAQWELEVGVVSGVSLLLLLSLVVFVIALVICKRKSILCFSKQMRVQEESSETEPLFTSVHGPYGSLAKQCGLSSLVSGEVSSHSLAIHCDLPPPMSDEVLSQGSSDEAELDYPRHIVDASEDKTQHSGTDHVPLRLLTRQDLVYIARVICDWKDFARHLGLEEADIVTIEQNHANDYEEQKMQMLLKWFQQQHSPPSCQSLVRVIEGKIDGHKLAQIIEQLLKDYS